MARRAAPREKGVSADRRHSSPLLRLLRYVRPLAGLIAACVLLTLLLSAGRYARAYLMKPILDDVLMPHQAHSLDSYTPGWVSDLPFVGKRDKLETAPPPPVDPIESAQREQLEQSVNASLRKIVMAALALVIGIPLVMFVRSYLMAYVFGRVHISIIRDVCSNLLALPLGYHHDRSRGDVLSRAIQDTAIARRAVKNMLGEMVESTLMIVIGVAMLFFISWRLALVSLAIGPLLVAVVSHFNVRIKATALRRQEKTADVTGRLVEILAGIKVIKAFRTESLERAAFRRETRKLFRRSMRVTKNREIARSLVAALNNAVAIGMLLLGVVLILSGGFGLTLGDLAAFTMVLQATYGPVRGLAKDWVQIVDAMPSVDRFFSILDAPAEADDPPDAVRIDGVHDRISLRSLSFSYGREPVLDDVSFEVAKGEVVALVGRTGAGKTTIADLLMRFHDPVSGSIEIDGVDVRAIARDSLLKQIAVVTQEPFLFDGTIGDNIRYGRIDASDEEVLEAARAAHVDEFASALPNGYDTPVGSDGVRLSGGQRQRITIARALLKNPPILIFDEATSALDSKSELLVQEAIESLLDGRTVFMIAHRLSTIRRADRIIVLEEGRVSQCGTHAELLAQPGLYRDLVRLQTTPTSSEPIDARG